MAFLSDKFILLSVLSLKRSFFQKNLGKKTLPNLKDAESPLPVNVRRLTSFPKHTDIKEFELPVDYDSGNKISLLFQLTHFFN